MFIRTAVTNTFRAMWLGIAHTSNLPIDPEIQEAATANAVMVWDSMRQPYALACTTAALSLRASSVFLTGSSIDRLAPQKISKLLDRWSRFPLSEPGDFVRAVGMFLLMGAMDHPDMFRVLKLDGQETYRDLVRTYHDLPSV